ncbi:hypothetical protein L1887_26914 [Cichorium endivia]|nr:hypothetical protein L1887_26914 [Cichorium endivia]
MEMGGELPVVASPPPPPPPPPPLTSFPLGFRFHPTDEELVTYYLRRKLCGKPFQSEMVPEVDVYKSEPWELADHTSSKYRDLEWYFISPLDKKYATSSRLNRATLRGYWKETGKIREVRHNSEKIGQKKSLIFHSGRPPKGKRTDWVMHEYKLMDRELETTGVAQDALVLCKIYQKTGLGPPSGGHYAPFFDEEWDEEDALLVPGGDKNDDVTNGNEARVERSKTVQMDPQTTHVACKRVRLENGASSSEPHGTLVPFHHKKSKGSDPSSSNANGSKDLTMTNQGPRTTNLAPALIEFPIMEPVTAKERYPPTTPPSFDVSALEKSVPPGYLELISDMEKKIHDVSMEKDMLKMELMQAQAMINNLHSGIDQLKKENTELRKGI